MFEYKCVSGPTIVAVKSAKARDQAVKAFEQIMNIEAAEGWEFVGIDEFHVSEPEGFLSRKRIYVPSKILVFRRAKVAAAATMRIEAPEPPTVAPEPKSEASRFADTRPLETRPSAAPEVKID
jgi:hypothetical protein